jgi:WD40 repeat protein
VQKQVKINTVTLGNQVSALESNRSSLFIASPDGHLKAFDSRSMKAITASVRLHEGWINAISCSPTDENQFCTAGADLRVCIWDRRGLALGPLKVLSGEDKSMAKKMLALDWNPYGLYFGGEDCILHRFG